MTARTERVVYWLFVAVVVGVVLHLANQWGQWQARRQALETQVVITDSLAAVYTADSTVWAGLVVTLIAHQDTLEEKADSLTGVAASQDSARVEAVTDLDALRAAAEVVPIPAPAAALVRGLENALTHTEVSLNTCGVQLTNAQEQITTCTKRQAIHDSALARAGILRGRLTAERDSARALLRPPPWFALAFEVNAGVGCVTTLSGTVACGPAVQVTLFRFRIPLFQ